MLKEAPNYVNNAFIPGLSTLVVLDAIGVSYRINFFGRL